MSCNCCCTNTLDLCEVSACDSVDLGITAQEHGAYKFVLDFLGSQITLTKDFDIDDELSFSVTDLNENMAFTGQVFAPSGKQILISKNGVIYDCIEFQTIVNIVIAA